MLKSCFENWTFGYLPGLLSRLYCTCIKIVWENLEKLNDGGLMPGLCCAPISKGRGNLQPLQRIYLDPGFTATVNTLWFYYLQPFDRATFLLNGRHILMFHFLFHCLLNGMWQILVFVWLKGLFFSYYLFFNKHLPCLLLFLPLGSNIWNHPGNNILTSIKLQSLRAQREADAGGSAFGNNTSSVQLFLPWKIDSHAPPNANPGNCQFKSNSQWKHQESLQMSENCI